MLGINIKKINPFSSFGGAKELLGIYISGNSLKFAQVKVSPNKKEVINLISRSITGLSDADIIKIIISTLSELKAKNAEIVNVIPSNLVISKNIEIPSVDPREIKEIINLQAGRHTPYSREEIIVDYIEIGTYKNNYTKVLLIIVARNIVKRQFELLSKSGIKLTKSLLAAEGLGFSPSRILKIEGGEAPLALIHLDEDFSDFTIILKNKILFVRSIPIGAVHLLSEKEKYQARFAEEVKRSLEAYQSEDIEKTPQQLIVSGATQSMDGLEAVLNEVLRIPIKTVPYLKNLALSAAALKTASEVKYISFLNVLAPLVSWEEMKVNLIPDEVKLKKSVEERGKDLIKTGILVLITLVLVFCILATKIYFKNAYLKELNTKYQSLGKEAQKLEKDFSKVSSIKSYILNRGYSLEVLAELYSVIPLDLQLDDIRFDDEQGRFSLRGTADSMSTVFSFVDGMQKSVYFREVKTKYTTKRKEKDKDVVDFEINCLFNRKVVK